MTGNKNILLFLLIILGSFFLFFYKLGSIPPGFNWDEVSHAYNAYSILKTGHDEWGQFLPLANFRAYGDYPLPLYMYLSMPAISIFGLSEMVIRSTSAVFGVLLVLITYGLSTIFLHNKFARIITTLVAMTAPWTIMISRQVLQATPAIFFLSLGVFLFIKYFQKNLLFFNLSMISLGISAYGYHNTRILAPIIACFLFAFCFRELAKQKEYLLSFFIWSAVFFIPLPFIILSPTGSARSQFVGIIDQGAINNINQSRGESTLPVPIEKLLYNKVTYFLEVSTKNYLGYFSPNYLGFQGGTQYQYSVPNLGLLYPSALIFIYIGLISMIINFKKIKKWQKFLLVWILISPLPASVTRDPYQVVRSTTMLPVLFLIFGVGFEQTVDLIKRYKASLFNIVVVIFLLLTFVSFGFYINILFGSYSKNYSFAWQYGYREAVNYVLENGDQYNNIVFTKRYGEPHEFVLFYSKYDPEKYQADMSSKRYYQNGWYLVDNFGKYQFIDDEKIQERTKNFKNSLLITTPDNYPRKGQVIDSVYFLNGSKAFDIVKLP